MGILKRLSKRLSREPGEPVPDEAEIAQALKGTVRMISACRDHQCGQELPFEVTASELEAMAAAAAAAEEALRSGDQETNDEDGATATDAAASDAVKFVVDAAADPAKMATAVENAVPREDDTAAAADGEQEVLPESSDNTDVSVDTTVAPGPPKIEGAASPVDVRDVDLIEEAPKETVQDVTEAAADAASTEEEAEEAAYLLYVGACTLSFLSSATVEEPEKKQSWIQLLDEMRTMLSANELAQVPQLSTSRQMDLNEPFTIMKPGSTKHKALIIGINYVYQQGELRGCHSDALKMRLYALQSGYADDNICMLLDAEGYMHPTADNMRRGFQWLLQGADQDTSLFLFYTGHGGQVPDHSGDEVDGYDEALVPVDVLTAGCILDDEIFATVVEPLPEGCELTVFMDCCHAGSMLDLPYTFMGTAGLISDVEAGRVAAALGHNPNFSVGRVMKVAKEMYALRKHGASFKQALSFGSRALGKKMSSKKLA